MSTAEELLCKKWWRLGQSIWMLWGVLTLGFLAFIGWGYIALKAKKWTWGLIAALLLACTITYIVLVTPLNLPGKNEVGTAEQERMSSFLGGIIMTYWVASTIGAWIVNRRWLTWRAHTVAGTANKRPAVADQFAAARVESALDPIASAVDALPSGQPDASRIAATADKVDVNSASREDFLSLPGITEESADAIITARSQVGSFQSPSDLVTLAGVKPHIFAGVQGSLLANPRPASPQPRDPGRRLEF